MKTKVLGCVSSRVFLSSFVMMFVALAMDRRETNRVLELSIDLPTYHVVSRKRVFQDSLVSLLGLEDHALRVPLVGIPLAKALGRISIGFLFSNVPVILATSCICSIAAYHFLALAAHLFASPTTGSRANVDKRHVRGVLRFLVILLFSFVCGGKGFEADTAVMETMKNFFQRLRPPEFAHDTRSLAFPSGHTNGAAFFFGALLVLMLPNLVRGLRARKKSLLGVWAFFTLLTGFGRVVALKHWCSDCICGACTGAITVSLTSLTVLHIERMVGVHEQDAPHGKIA